MKHRFVVGFLTWGVVALAGVSSYAQTNTVASVPQPLFHASFDHTLEPVTVGDSNFRWTCEEDPPYRPGVSGQAILFGRAGLQKQTVYYTWPGEKIRERGSLTFWTRQLKAEHAPAYSLLAFWGKNDIPGWVQIYKWEWYEFLALRTQITPVNSPNPQDFVSFFPAYRTNNNDWQFVAIVWEGDEVSLFANGKFCVREKHILPDITGTQFRVGADNDTGGERLMDELKIYDVPLSSSEVTRLYQAEGRLARGPVATVPPARRAVQVDGVLAPGEWDDATMVAGFCNHADGLAANTETRALLKYDEQNLYVAFESDLPRKVLADIHGTAGMSGMLKAEAKTRDGKLEDDDRFEVTLFPPGQETSYRFAANSLPTQLQQKSDAAGKADNTFQANWQCRSANDMKGWRMEMAIPWTALGTRPKAGDPWGLNLTRVWQALQKERDEWAWGENAPAGRFESPARGWMMLAGRDSPVVRLLAVGEQSGAGHGELKAEIANGAAHRLLRAAFQSDQPGLSEKADWNLSPSAKVEFKRVFQITDPATGLLTFQVEDPTDKKTIFKQAIGMCQAQTLNIQLARYPSLSLVRVFLDVGRLRKIPLEQLNVEVTVASASAPPSDSRQPVTGDASRPLFPPKSVKLKSWQDVVDLDITKLPVGKYNVQVKITDGRQSVAFQEIPYEKKPLPIWYGNPIGISDQVPKPWTPIQRQGDTVNVWGRSYRFEGRMFPSQITTTGAEILQAPMALRVTDPKGTVSSTAVQNAKLRWTKTTETRVEFNTEGVCGPLRIRAETWLEYDGLLWTTLDLEAMAAVKEVTLDIPMRKEWSTLINPNDYGLSNSGLLKPEGYTTSVVPLWLGNEAGGLQWMTEASAAWPVEDQGQVLRAIPRNKDTVMRVVLANQPLAAGRKFHVEFGLVATPTRPRTPEYRQIFTGQSRLNPGYGNYLPTERWYDLSCVDGNVTRLDDSDPPRMQSGGAYVIHNALLPGTPYLDDWADEWSVSPTPANRQQMVSVSVTSRSLQDYFLWVYSRHYRRTRYLGLYYDCCGATADSNPYHGGGVPMPDGSYAPRMNILGARQIAQRLYTWLREVEPDRTMVIYHNSGMPNMAFLSFAELLADGENTTSALGSSKLPDLRKAVRVDSFRASCMMHNFGPADWFLSEFSRSGSLPDHAAWEKVGGRPVYHYLGLILMHDSLPWFADGDPIAQEAYKKVVEVFKKYNWDERYRMVPYWSQQVASLPDADMYATWYVDDRARRTILILLNNSETYNGELRLKMNWKALGYPDPKGLTAEDPVFGPGARIEGNDLIFPVTPVNARFIIIQPKEK